MFVFLKKKTSQVLTPFRVHGVVIFLSRSARMTVCLHNVFYIYIFFACFEITIELRLSKSHRGLT